MKVIFNTLATLQPKTGVGHYAAHLFESMSNVLGANCLSSFPGKSLSTWLTRGPNLGTRPARRQGSIRPWFTATAKSFGRSALGAMFHMQHGPDKYDLYHEPNFLPMPSRLPVVVTVHDLSVLLHPEWHPIDRVKRHETRFRQAIADARHVITVSETVRQDVMRHLNVPPSLVTAVHNGISAKLFNISESEIVSARSKYGLTGDYLLYCGTIEPRKNLDTLLRAYCDLPADLRSRCPLVLAGGWGWKSESVAEFYASTASTKDVRAIGYVNDDVRMGLFAGARTLVFPSHHEGFGLPPLEMLATGGSVLASDISAHREVLGQHAQLVDPDDVAAWRENIKQAITADDHCVEINEARRNHARQFSWLRAAKQTIAVYERVLQLRQAA